MGNTSGVGSLRGLGLLTFTLEKRVKHPSECRILSGDQTLYHRMVHADLTLLQKTLDIEPLLEITLGDVKDA